MTEEEYREEIVKQVRSQNINLVEIQNQLDKQDKKLKDIQNNVGCLTTIMLLPIAIGVIALIISAIAGYNILENIAETFQTTPQATAYVTDEEGNIIPDEEYHGQNVAVPIK